MNLQDDPKKPFTVLLKKNPARECVSSDACAVEEYKREIQMLEARNAVLLDQRNRVAIVLFFVMFSVPILLMVAHKVFK